MFTKLHSSGKIWLVLLSIWKCVQFVLTLPLYKCSFSYMVLLLYLQFPSFIGQHLFNERCQSYLKKILLSNKINNLKKVLPLTNSSEKAV